MTHQTQARWRREERRRKIQRLQRLPRRLSGEDWMVVAALVTASLVFAGLVYRQDGATAAILGLLWLYIPVAAAILGLWLGRRERERGDRAGP